MSLSPVNCGTKRAMHLRSAEISAKDHLHERCKTVQVSLDVSGRPTLEGARRHARQRSVLRTSAALGRARRSRRLIEAYWPVFVLTALISSTMTATAFATPERATSTVNWSGYGLAGSGFTGVTGTFVVPAPLLSASCIEETAVWVGLDGMDNNDLLQAGVAETGFATASSRTPPYGPSSGFPGLACSRQAQVYAWWEDLPSAPERVDLPVKVGDSVSVSIFKMSPGWWAIAVHDLTIKKSFLLAQPYAGPQTSVEWVVEVPEILGLARDPVPFKVVYFRDLSAQGQARDLERFSSNAGNAFVSRPDLVASTAQLMRSGFGVHLTLRND
jgi:Peptidase A4 family